MMLHPRRRAWATALFLLLPLGRAQATTVPPAPAAPRCLAVVGTNDLHGAIAPYVYGGADGQVEMGGVIGQSAYVAALRARFGERLALLDGGDLFQGTMPSNLSEGRAVIDAYNAMGYTAAAIGNHEFDFGAGSHGAADDRLAVLRARVAQAQFPFLAANIEERSSGAQLSWDNVHGSVMRTLGGIKVGIIGASTPETPLRTKPQNVASLRFLAPLGPVRAAATALRQQGAELVVLVAHMGGRCRSLKDPDNAASCQAEGVDAELTALLAALPPGLIDVAVGGHTHRFMAHWINGTAAIESGSRGQYLGWVEACVAPGGGIERATSSIHGATPLCLTRWQDGSCLRRQGGLPVQPAPYLGTAVQPMATVQRAMAPYLAATAAAEAAPIGVRLPTPLAGPALADQVAEAVRSVGGADVGLQNRGGVRQGLPAGDLTYGQIYNALPFDNAIVRVQLSGAQLGALFAQLGPSNRRGAAFAGLASCRGSTAVCDAHNQPLVAQQRYTLSTNDFVAQGGDGAVSLFRQLPGESIVATDVVLRDALVTWLRQQHPAPTATAPASLRR